MDEHRAERPDPHSDLSFLTLGPDALGPDALGPDALGPDALGPDALGPDALGPDVSATDAAEGTLAARVRGYETAVGRAFLEGRSGPERHRYWLEHLRADSVTLRGAWVTQSAIGPAAVPVATFSGFDKTLNVGGGRLLGLHMITDVTVSPTHRRRGLTRRLMTEDLAAAAERGVALAALTVSEGSIYGRFGFGSATWLRRIEVDATARFALRAEVADRLAADEGRFELVEPEAAWPAVQHVFGRVHRLGRGSVDRPRFYEPISTGRLDFFTDSPDPKLRALVHIDVDGQADGYVLYRPVEVDGVEVLEVRDLLSVDPVTHLRLWRFLAEMDLVTRIRSGRSAVDDPLEHALVEPRAVRVVGVTDLLWVRVLNVVAALEARPWYAQDELVLEVDDPLGHAHGRWWLQVAGGAARVEATRTEPDVRLPADALGSLYLGGVAVATLHAAGRIAGTRDAVDRLGRLADGGPAPHCVTSF